MQNLNPEMVVVLPARPPIDKLVAYKRVQLDREGNARLRVAFCDVNEPTPDQLSKWSSMCSGDKTPYLLDVGQKKYHQLGSSASEVEQAFSATRNGRIFNSLVGLINQNNRTGFLKKQRHSVAKLLREAYPVMNGNDSSQEVVFDHGMAVVDAFFYPSDKRAWDTLFSDPQYRTLKRLWCGFGVKEAEVLPFTLPLYFKQLFMSGRKEAEILAAITWWIDKQRRVDKAKAEAANRSFAPRPFRVCGKVAGLIHVNGCFESEAFISKWLASSTLCVGIIRNERGQVQINGSKGHTDLDLDSLFDELSRREPGLWYKEGRFKVAMIMNGSNQFTGVPPSSIPDDELIRLICMLVKCKKQS